MAQVLLNHVQSYLKFLKEMGVTGFDCSSESLEMLKNWGKTEKKVLKKQDKKIDTLEHIRIDLRACDRCELSFGN